MRYILSDEEIKLANMIAPYIYIDKETHTSLLREDAPEEVKKAKQKLHELREKHYTLK